MDKDILRWLMGCPEGRMAMMCVLAMTGVYRTDYSDAEKTNMLLAGRRSIGTDLLAEIRSLERESRDGEDGLAMEYQMLREEEDRRRRAKEADNEKASLFYKE